MELLLDHDWLKGQEDRKARTHFDDAANSFLDTET
jgi:hypothetical protein